MTDNAAELFGAEARDLQGRKLTDFMPKEFAEKHDMIVNTFLNGQSRSKFNAEIPVVMLSEGGQIKSVTIIPRVEAVFTEEIYIGAMIQKRNQLALSTTVTSLGGRVQKIGRPCSQFKWTLQEGDSVFRVVPGLFHALYPHSRTSFSSRMRRAEERVHDATTLRPPDFEKSMIDPSTRSFGGETEMLAATKTIRVGQTQRGETIPLDDAFASQSALFNPQAPDVQPGQTVTTLTEVFMYCFYDGVPSSAAIEEWRKTDALYSAVAQQIPGRKKSAPTHTDLGSNQLAESDLVAVCRWFAADTQHYLDNIGHLRKVCLKVDTHHYENGSAVREVSVMKTDPPASKHYLFFQMVASRIPKVLGVIASISPETVDEINRLWMQSKRSHETSPEGQTPKSSGYGKRHNRNARLSQIGRK